MTDCYHRPIRKDPVRFRGFFIPVIFMLIRLFISCGICIFASMNKYIEILNLIRIIRESFPQSVEVYTQGSCFRFALILKTVYPDGDIHWNQDHATFCLDGHFYDITGDVAPEGRGEKIEDWGIREIEKVLKLRYGESEKV